MIIRTLADIHQFLLTTFRIFTILHGSHAPLLGSCNLNALAVRKLCLVIVNTTNGMIFLTTLDNRSILNTLSPLNEIPDYAQNGYNNKECCQELTLRGMFYLFYNSLTKHTFNKSLL